MLPLYFLILWAIYYRDDASAIKYDWVNTSESVAIANWSAESNENTGDEEIASLKGATDSFPPSQDGILADELVTKDTQPTSHSPSNFKDSTQARLQGMRKGDEDLKLQLISDYILVISWSNGTANHTSWRTPRELLSFRYVPICFSQIIQPDGPAVWQKISGESTESVVTYPGGLIDDPSYWPKLYVSFEELGLGDIIIAPFGVLWTVCSKRADVIPEILTKLNDSSYPLPLAVAATLTLEAKFKFSLSETGSKCVPTGWKSMSVMFLSNYYAFNTQLDSFLPTACYCRY